jgi:hypothetical protein
MPRWLQKGAVRYHCLERRPRLPHALVLSLTGIPQQTCATQMCHSPRQLVIAHPHRDPSSACSLSLAPRHRTSALGVTAQRAYPTLHPPSIPHRTGASLCARCLATRAPRRSRTRQAFRSDTRKGSSTTLPGTISRPAIVVPRPSLTCAAAAWLLLGSVSFGADVDLRRDSRRCPIATQLSR